MCEVKGVGFGSSNTRGPEFEHTFLAQGLDTDGRFKNLSFTVEKSVCTIHCIRVWMRSISDVRIVEKRQVLTSASIWSSSAHGQL